jgi:hypothetical protein
MKVTLKKPGSRGEEELKREYPFVIATLPSGAYLNGEFGRNLLNDISFAKAQALRECDYMAAFKAFLTFKTQFWTQVCPRQEGGYGAASTDRPNRQIIYPSYGYEGTQGVLQVYCWAQDARRLGALDDRERIAEYLKGIAYLYPDVDVEAEFAGYDDGKTTKTWFWDSHRFLEQAIPIDAERRDVLKTPFSYAYVHDAMLWYRAIHKFAGDFVDTHYAGGDEEVAGDVQLQRFFDKLIPAFNYVDGVTQAHRFPASVRTKPQLKEVLAMFVWQFSVQHTVVNDGAYNQAAFVPNASTLMYAPPAGKPSSEWSPAEVIAWLP